MKKFLLVVGVLMAEVVSAQTINWDLSPITTMLRTLIPNILAVICVVALVGWTAFNLFKNWDNRQEIMTNFLWTLLGITIAYGIVRIGITVFL
ncbi:MAG: hypothetical protein NC250_01000 [Alistipes senegalensis]|nr:hypothetical protein [Bacteroides cellulosilyticus]MCM1351298.1 hypothetical protein [Alistipes senegalensis]